MIPVRTVFRALMQRAGSITPPMEEAKVAPVSAQGRNKAVETRDGSFCIRSSSFTDFLCELAICLYWYNSKTPS